MQSPEQEEKGNVARCYCIDQMAKQGNKSQQVEGVVEHLNFAKNGEPNGAVLDSGHFVHIKHRAARSIGLRVGQALRVRGKLKTSSSGGQKVIDAEIVNGTDVTSARAANKPASTKTTAKRAHAKKAASKKTVSKAPVKKKRSSSARA